MQGIQIHRTMHLLLQLNLQGMHTYTTLLLQGLSGHGRRKKGHTGSKPQADTQQRTRDPLWFSPSCQRENRQKRTNMDTSQIQQGHTGSTSGNANTTNFAVANLMDSMSTSQEPTTNRHHRTSGSCEILDWERTDQGDLTGKSADT